MKTFNDETYMNRCFDLALFGEGKVSPNPMVGCVIVRNGKIVGEGSHLQFGGPHAEVFALLHAGKKTKGATLYVNLEPCAHFGKTPPCVDAIIKSGVAKVVIAVKDPNPLVSGKGIKRLRASGIEVKVAVLQTEAERLNEKFFKFMKQGIPFVTIKLAQTIDGRIADIQEKSRWITSKASRKEVHRLRGEYDAVMVGAKTVLKDNPQLTVRNVKGRNPVRVVIDGSLQLPISCKIFDTSDAPTWVLTSKEAIKLKLAKVQKLASQNVRVISVGAFPFLNPRSILKVLSLERISSVLIEGGSILISNFIQQSLADKLMLFIAPNILGGGLEGFHLIKPKPVNRPIRLSIINISKISDDLLVEANFIKERK